jgi:hypothetical protein
MSNGGAARQLTDDRFISDRPTAIDSRVGTSVPMLTYESFVRRYGAEAETPTVPWQQETIRRLSELGELSPGWDGYRAPAISLGTLSFAIQLLGKVMRSRTPLPQVVPSSVGGVQIEWHERDIDLEIHIAAPYRCELWYENHRSGEIIDQELTADFSPLTIPVAELSRY